MQHDDTTNNGGTLADHIAGTAIALGLFLGLPIAVQLAAAGLGL